MNTFDQVALYNSVKKYIPISWQSFSGKSTGGANGETQVATVSAPMIPSKIRG
jgi:hypothetical protein